MKHSFCSSGLVFSLGLSLCLCPGFSSVANAHFVWVLKTGDQVQVSFSESAESAEPELLRNVAAARVWAQVRGDGGSSSMLEVPLTLSEQSLSGRVDPKSDAILLSHQYGVVSEGGAAFLLQYLAKQHGSPLPGQWTAVNDTERLPLEVTPSWSGNQLVLTVTWKGDPTPGLEVKATGCGIDDTLVSDEAGVVRCEPGTDGVLSVRAKIVDAVSGELNGMKYDSVRTYSTLTLPLTRPTVMPLTDSLPPLPRGITSFGAAIAGDHMYVYGGHFGAAHHYSEGGQSNEFRRLSLTDANPEWQLLAGGPRLTGLALVEYGGRLYRAGGFTAKNGEDEEQSLWSQDSFASFDPASGEWTDLAPLPEGRSSHDAAVIDGRLYVAGGWNMQGPDTTTWHTTALVCDLTNSDLRWTELPTPPFQRRAVSLAAFQGRLYVIGGMQQEGGITSEVAVFDPATNTWGSAPALHGTGMEGFGTSAFAAGNRLVVTTMSGSIQTLTGDGAQWVVAGQAKEPRFFHRQLTTADGRVLVVGGAAMATGKTTSVELMQFVGE